VDHEPKQKTRGVSKILKSQQRHFKNLSSINSSFSICTNIKQTRSWTGGASIK